VVIARRGAVVTEVPVVRDKPMTRDRKGCHIMAQAYRTIRLFTVVCDRGSRRKMQERRILVLVLAGPNRLRRALTLKGLVAAMQDVPNKNSTPLGLSVVINLSSVTEFGSRNQANDHGLRTVQRTAYPT